MCGIVGYIGKREAKDVLINGLKRLEYRGYDSAGLATINEGTIEVARSQGKVADLESKAHNQGQIGIAHTRWATHGEPSERNAHPHTAGDVTVVHNGIIENYAELKERLSRAGYTFASDTDTEVLAALIDSFYQKDKDMVKALPAALEQTAGTFGLLVLVEGDEQTIYAARRGSPLLIGVGNNEYVVASDASAVVEYTGRVIYLDEDQMAVINESKLKLMNLDNSFAEPNILEIDTDHTIARKDGFDHFLIKEIFEQPQAIQNCLRGRLVSPTEIRSDGLDAFEEPLRKAKHIYIIGCGTAYFAGLLGKYQLESLLGVSVSVEHASEFRYRDVANNQDGSIAIFMTQSGETADTLAALRKCKKIGLPTFGIVNVVGSTIAREVDAGLYMHAGPEISVASTKAYSTMVISLLILGLYTANLHNSSSSQLESVFEGLKALPQEIEAVLETNDHIAEVAQKYIKTDHAFYLGRDYLYPSAEEGALKLMEISYIHAHAYPMGEMKHGPIALEEPGFLNVALLPDNKHMFDKAISNIQEIKARKGEVLAISSRPIDNKLADEVLHVPKSSRWIEPLLINVASQLFAYHVAAKRGLDVDQPRNLAKSVTVE